MTVYAYGSSHSIGFNQLDWSSSKRFTSTCYPKLMADALGTPLVHNGHIGLGVDYVSKQIVSNAFNGITDDDLAVVQLYGIYGFKTLFEPKFNRTFAAVTQYTSLDSKTFNFKLQTSDEEQDFIDYMHNVNTIVARCQQIFKRSINFICAPLRDQNEMFKKVELFSKTERDILSRFKYNLTHLIHKPTLQEFARSVSPRYTSDGVHYNEQVHVSWADHLLATL